MPENLSQEKVVIVDTQIEYAVALMEHGYSKDQVKETFIRQGLTPDAALIGVSLAEAYRHEAYRRAQNVVRSAAFRNMAIGGGICILGILITAGAYASASGGGSYVICWGAILFGGAQFFRGWSQYNQLFDKQ